MSTAISMCSSGPAQHACAISLYWRVSSRRMWLETICQATPPLPFTLSIWSSRHSRRLRAPHARRIERLHRLQPPPRLPRSSARRRRRFPRARRNRYPSSSRLPMMDSAASRTASGDQADAQLRAQVIAQGDRRGKEGLEGRLFDRFRGRALIAGIQVVVEKRAEIDLVERIGGRRRFERVVASRRRASGPGSRGGGFLGVREEIAVDGHVSRIAIQRVGFVQYGGFQNLPGRPGRLSGFRLEQRQQFLRRDLLAGSSVASSRTGFLTISCVIISFSSSRLS